MQKEHIFMHIDGDAFFAACAIALNPELAGRAVVTGRERGIVTAASYEAKVLGITRAMPMWEVRKRFPQVAVVESDYNTITIFSKRIINIVRRYTPKVEEYSVDECFADLSELYLPTNAAPDSFASAKHDAISVARQIQKEIEEELNITVSVGLGPTKVLAKVASKFKKPRGFTVITQENREAYLSQVPVASVWGIGRRTSVFLEKSGVKTALQFTALTEKWIDATLTKPFLELWHELRGRNILRVHTREEAEDQKSISKTATFTPPSRSPIYVFAELSKNIENACAKMRKEGLRGKRAVMFIKRQDFKYHSIECVVPYPTNSPEDFLAIAKERFSELFKANEDYRATGFTVYDLSPLPLQQDLFGRVEKTGRFESVHKAADAVDRFFGKHTLYLGTSAKALFAREDLGSTKANPKNFFDKFAIPFGGSVA